MAVLYGSTVQHILHDKRELLWCQLSPHLWHRRLSLWQYTVYQCLSIWSVRKSMFITMECPYFNPIKSHFSSTPFRLSPTTFKFCWGIGTQSVSLSFVTYTSMLYYRVTHRGRLTHICLSKLTVIGSDNGLSPGRCQTIIWTNTAVLLIRTLGTDFIEILYDNRACSFKRMHLKISSAKWRNFVSALMC